MDLEMPLAILSFVVAIGPLAVTLASQATKIILRENVKKTGFHSFGIQHFDEQ